MLRRKEGRKDRSKNEEKEKGKSHGSDMKDDAEHEGEVARGNGGRRNETPPGEWRETIGACGEREGGVGSGAIGAGQGRMDAH